MYFVSIIAKLMVKNVFSTKYNKTLLAMSSLVGDPTHSNKCFQLF